MTFTPSRYQQAIYDHIADNPNHLNIEAGPGSGKTTTIVKALDFVDENLSTVFCAFNKHSADDLKDKVPMHVQTATINALGHRILAKKMGWLKVNENKIPNLLRYDVLKPESKDDWKEFFKMRGPVSRILSLVRATNGDIADWQALADKYDIDFPDDKDFTRALYRVWDLYQSKTTKTIDYDDQLYLPVVNNLIVPTYDRIFVDECQDLSTIQIEFIARLLKPGGKIVTVGDRNQSIYGFRGADPDAVDKIIKRFNADSLPLSICYRCSKAVVKNAQRLVPGVEEYEGAPEGTVETISEDEFVSMADEGDYVLCRVTAPLVKACLNFIRNGKRAYVRGRKIGEQLIETIKRLYTDGDTVDQLIANLSEYEHAEESRLSARGRDSEVINLNDTVATIIALLDSVDTVDEVFTKIKELFHDDDRLGVMCCTAHRSKGLETNRTFIIQPELMPHKKAKKNWQQIQEKNLQFVAETRSKHDLFYVTTKVKK